MENPFEILEQHFNNLLTEMESRLAAEIIKQREYIPGIDLERYIPIKKVAELYGVASKTLAAHKHEIEHVKRFGQIYFLKSSLLAYMDGGKEKSKHPGIMRTRRNSVI
jgi:hypothetical protein